MVPLGLLRKGSVLRNCSFAIPRFAFCFLSSCLFSEVLSLHPACRCFGIWRSILSCAIAPHTFLREIPLNVHLERLCHGTADADLSHANSSPESPLHSKGRAASPFVVQSAASTVPCEWNSPGGISSRLSGNSDRTTGQSSGISSPFFMRKWLGFSDCGSCSACQGPAF